MSTALICIYFAKCFQVQNRHTKSMVEKRPLNILYNKQYVFLRINWIVKPITFKQAVRQFFKTFSGRFSIEAVQEKNDANVHRSYKYNCEIKIRMSKQLQIVREWF